MGFLNGSVDKEFTHNAGNTGDMGSIPGSGRSPEGRNGNPPQYFCPKKSHGQRSLTGCSPRGHKALDMTEYACIHVVIQLVKSDMQSDISLKGTKLSIVRSISCWYIIYILVIENMDMNKYL